MALNINSLTLGEVALVENLSNQPFAAIADDEKPKGLALAALAYVAKRRVEPAFTWNAAQELTFADFAELISMGDTAAESDPLAAVQGDAVKASTPKRSERAI